MKIVVPKDDQAWEHHERYECTNDSKKSYVPKILNEVRFLQVVACCKNDWRQNEDKESGFFEGEGLDTRLIRVKNW
jgi:hypothetical protein